MRIIVAAGVDDIAGSYTHWILCVLMPEVSNSDASESLGALSLKSAEFL